MATLQAATTSSGAFVTDPQAVRQPCENHYFGMLNWEVDEDGEFTIRGLDDFEVCAVHEDGLPDYDGGIVTHEFLRTLAGYLESGEELDIQTAGYTKCRFPVLAKRYSVREDKVEHTGLSDLNPIGE